RSASHPAQLLVRRLRFSGQRQLGSNLPNRQMVNDMDGGVGQQVEPEKPVETVTGESLVSRISSGLGRMGPVAAIALFGVAILVLHRELAAYSYRDITRAIEELSASQLALGIGFTVLAYAVFPGYDAVALSYIRHPLPFRR